VKKTLAALFVAGMMMTGFANAAQNIAFVDADAAILNSEPAKERIAELKKRLAPEQNKIKELEQMIRGLQTQLQQDAAVMSEAEKRNLNNEIEVKVVEYQQRLKQLQESQMSSQQELMQEFGPKFKNAVTELMEEGGYNTLMHLKAAIIVDPKDNLTKRVTENINANP
jgi:outer membrane protein